MVVLPKIKSKKGKEPASVASTYDELMDAGLVQVRKRCAKGDHSRKVYQLKICTFIAC